MRLALFAIGLTLVGCSEPTATQPLPPVTSDASVPVPSPPARRAFHRNPFGDVAQRDNLFVDGDFDITGRGNQAGWIVENQQQQGTLNYDTGGRCRSGIRCAVIGPGDILVGLMSSPVNEDYEITIYVQPDSQRCADASVFTLDINGAGQSQSLSSMTTVPDVDGWCLFAAKASNLAYDQPAVAVMLTTSAKSKTVHVDQGTALPVTEVPVHGAFPALGHPSAIDAAHLAGAAASIRSHRKFGRDVPRTDPR